MFFGYIVDCWAPLSYLNLISDWLSFEDVELGVGLEELRSRDSSETKINELYRHQLRAPIPQLRSASQFIVSSRCFR